MRKKLSKSVCQVGKSIIREMSLKAAAYDNVISLGIGEPDFNTPETVCNAALRMEQAVFEEMVAEFEARCRLAYERLKAISGIKVHLSQGSFYLFPNVAEIMKETTKFALELLDREQVVVIPGEAFGSSGRGCVRISCTVNQARLAEAMDRFEHFIQS